jgi:hypothetical protein
MDLKHGDDTPWECVSGHRGDGIDFRRLLAGDNGAKDNHHLSLWRENGRFFSPRHRHNFDQVRICLEGEVSVTPDQTIRPGGIGYFPEGAAYGPQDSDKQSVGMVVQFGGASGEGFVSLQQVAAAHEELKQHGSFEGGVFRRRDGLSDSGKKNQDGYEAIWEHVTGRRLAYPKPRYDAPFLMDPKNYAWEPDAKQDGVSHRHLGTFTERHIELSLLRIRAGRTCLLPSRGGRRLHFALGGAGTAADLPYRKLSAWSTAPGETVAMKAEVESEIFVLGLPIFEPARSTP